MKNKSCILLVSLLTWFLGTAPSHATLINGDFQTGDLTGWTQFNSPNGGTSVADVVSFDTSGSGTPSLSAQFEVGETSGIIGGGGLGQGAGIYQNLALGAGLLSINMNIAAQSPGNNADGGTFELLLDGNLVATYAFGTINFDQTKLATLDYSGEVTAGIHQISIEMLRGYGTIPGDTPYQYIDNILLSGSAVPDTTDTAALLALGLVLVIFFPKLRHNFR